MYRSCINSETMRRRSIKWGCAKSATVARGNAFMSETVQSTTKVTTVRRKSCTPFRLVSKLLPSTVLKGHTNELTVVKGSQWSGLYAAVFPLNWVIWHNRHSADGYNTCACTSKMQKLSRVSSATAETPVRKYGRGTVACSVCMCWQWACCANYLSPLLLLTVY